MKLLMVGFAIAASGCAAIMHSEPEYKNPRGSTPLTILNQTINAVCTFEIGGNHVDTWDPLAVDGNPGAPHTKIGPGHSLDVGVKPGTYQLAVTTCDCRQGNNGAVIEISGPMVVELSSTRIGGGDAHHVYVGLGRFVGPYQRDLTGCKPAGDTTVNSDGCCSGRVVMSGKHPGPSHCAYDDE